MTVRNLEAPRQRLSSPAVIVANGGWTRSGEADESWRWPRSDPFGMISAAKAQSLNRRDGRVVEGARLESVYTVTYRGFESLSLRH